jgi:hypothetical protein
VIKYVRKQPAGVMAVRTANVRKPAVPLPTIIFAALLLSSGCSRGDPIGPDGKPLTFAYPEILQLRILVHPVTDEAVYRQAKDLQQNETDLGRPWSTDVYRDPNQKTDLIARWYPADDDFGRNSALSSDLVIRQIKNPPAGASPYQVLVLTDQFNINRADFARVRPDLDEGGRPCVSFSMTSSGAKKLHALTSQRLPKNGHHSCLAILFDEQVVSAPQLKEAIENDGLITGNFTRDEVTRLADMCNVTHAVKRQPAPPPVAAGGDTVNSPKSTPTSTAEQTFVGQPFRQGQRSSGVHPDLARQPFRPMPGARALGTGVMPPPPVRPIPPPFPLGTGS